MCRFDCITAQSVALEKTGQIGQGAGTGIGRFHRYPRRFDDDYTLTKQVLGVGGFASVCTAVSRHTRRNFAVKRLSLIGLSAIQLARILTEASILHDMDHPNVVRLVDMYHGDEALDIVMERMEGGELFDRLVDYKKFEEADAARTLRQILLALSYVHKKSIAHRDLKLENVLYEKKGGDHVKVVDFGLAKVMEKNMVMSPMAGTPGYFAPEITRTDYSTQCDLWSLGVVAHTLLVGRMPPTRLWAKYGFSLVPEEWAGVSGPCFDFVKGLLMPDPSRRLTTQQALAHPWLAEQRRFTAQPRVSKRVLSGLKAFAQASPFRRACMSAMAWSLDGTEQAKVRDAFAAFDQSHTGVICGEEMQTLLVGTFGVGQSEAMSLVSILDTTGDNTITYSEFLAAMCSKTSVKEYHVGDVFRRFDCDGSGNITAGNLRDVLQCPQAGKSVTALLAEADTSGDGAVTLGELSAFLRPRRMMLCLSALAPFAPNAK